MPNIRILAKAVLQIFCSHKMPVSEKGSSSTKNLRNRFRSETVHLHRSLYLYAKYQDPSLSDSSDIRFTRLFLYKKPGVRKREVTKPKIYGISLKVNHFIYTMICNYMPNIRILALAVLQILCSQGCSYTNFLFPKKRGVTQPKIYGISSKFNHFIYTLVCT